MAASWETNVKMNPTAIFRCAALAAILASGPRAAAQADFDAQGLIDRLVALQPKESLAQSAKTGVRFDANQYFTVLDQLHPDAGLVLDWTFWDRGSGGLPVLYMRESGAVPFADYGAYAAQATNAAANGVPPAGDAKESLRFGYLEKIHAENSPEGFFQLAALRLLGDRFHLSWHEYYNEIFLVGSRPGWEALLRREQRRGKPYDPPPPKFIAAAKKIDFAPRVRMGERQVDVDVIAYAPFRGIDRHHLEMSRTYPHRILAHATTNLLRHSQRFVF